MTHLKKISLLLAFALFTTFTFASGEALARKNMGGGFTGEGPKVTTITEALNLPDESWISLQGNIVRNHGDEKYTFRDASGEAIVEIDDDIWRGQTIGANDFVQILVEVEKEWGKTELEVAEIKIIQK